MTMYSDICAEIMRKGENHDFDDLRLVMHFDSLSDLMIEMGSQSAILNASEAGRPTAFGHVPIVESLVQRGWSVEVHTGEARS